MYTLYSFYRSKEWERFRQVVIAERIKDDGFVYDEITGKPIVRPYDLILHHKIELTEENVNDYSISLNPDNIQIVSHKTHNLIHDRLGCSVRQVYLVYGPPLSGKTSYVDSVKSEGDLIVDIDSIWQCISGCDRYVKPPRLKQVVFGVRDNLLEAIKYRRGYWSNAYLIGGYPLISERERLAKELGARLIYIDATKGECYERLQSAADARAKQGWQEYIDKWFRLAGPQESAG